MSNDEKDEPLNFLLTDGGIGIDGNQFIVDQSAIISASIKTNRELLVRILSRIEGTDINELLNQSIASDVNHLKEIISQTTKYPKR